MAAPDECVARVQRCHRCQRRARYLVDDVEAGIGGTQTSAPARPGPWQHADVIDGELEHRIASVDFARDDNTMTTSAVPELEGAHVDPAVGTETASSYVLVVSIGLEEPCTGDPDAERAVHVQIDSTTQTVAHATDNCAYASTYGTVRSLATRPTHAGTGYSSLNSSAVKYLGSQLLLLGLR